MSKYIIEIEEKPLCVFDKDTQTFFPRLWRVKGFNSLVLDEEGLSRLEELNSDYINEHYGELQDEAYQRGLSEGNDIGYKDGVKDGQNEAWGAAKKLFSTMAESDIEKAFPTEWNNGGFNALINLQPQEAIEKLKAYEEKQKDDEIKIGDEVTDIQSGANFLVTHLWKSNHGDKGVSGFNNDCSAFSATLNKVSKTGRHFDIDKILEEMRHD